LSYVTQIVRSVEVNIYMLLYMTQIYMLTSTATDYLCHI
jgi:hypothetical protein